MSRANHFFLRINYYYIIKNELTMKVFLFLKIKHYKDTILLTCFGFGF